MNIHYYNTEKVNANKSASISATFLFVLFFKNKFYENGKKY